MQHAGLPLPLVAIVLEVFAALKDLELDHAEHPIVVLDQNTEPTGRRTLNCVGIKKKEIKLN